MLRWLKVNCNNDSQVDDFVHVFQFFPIKKIIHFCERSWHWLHRRAVGAAVYLSSPLLRFRLASRRCLNRGAVGGIEWPGVRCFGNQVGALLARFVAPSLSCMLAQCHLGAPHACAVVVSGSPRTCTSYLLTPTGRGSLLTNADRFLRAPRSSGWCTLVDSNRRMAPARRLASRPSCACLAYARSLTVPTFSRGSCFVSRKAITRLRLL